MLAKRLIYHRQKQGWTQQKLAELLNVSVSGVQKWEHGRAEPNARILQRMADLFDVTMDELCDRIPPETNERIMVRAFRQMTEYDQEKLIAVGKSLYGYAFEE